MPRLIWRWGLFTSLTLVLLLIFPPSRLGSIWAFIRREDTFRLPLQYGPPRDTFRKWRLIPHTFAVPFANFTGLPKTPPADIPGIQHDFSAYREPEDRKEERLRRAETVKTAFKHSWEGYRRHAWLSDEVLPISGKSANPFGSWGATMVDSLDTLFVMGLEKEFVEAVKTLKQVDFTRCGTDEISLFETSIRYLGGLLGAYDVSGGKYPILLQKAIELGEMLYHAFDTEFRMPVLRWKWKASERGEVQTAPEYAIVAELGGLALEFTRLSQLTTDHKYFDAINRITHLFAAQQNATKLPGLWPVRVNVLERDLTQDTTFSFGGMADSLYETLPKQYLLLGGRDEIYRDMYLKAINAAKEFLAFEPLIPLQDTNTRLAAVGKRDAAYSFSPDFMNPVILGTASVSASNPSTQTLVHEPQGQHLTCFAGGMAALAAQAFQDFQDGADNQEDLTLAKRLTAGCTWSYRATATGIGPEIFYTHPCRRGRASISAGAEPDWIGHGKGASCRWDRSAWVQAVREQHLQADSTDSSTNARLESEDPDRWEHVIQKLRLGEGSIEGGFTDVPDPRYMLRPEVAESLFVLWRVTGDPKYQDQAWDMFTAITNLTKTQVGFASVKDVTWNPEAKRRHGGKGREDGGEGDVDKEPDKADKDDKDDKSKEKDDKQRDGKQKRDDDRGREKEEGGSRVRSFSLAPRAFQNLKNRLFPNRSPERFIDKQESYWMAATLKYLYLTFADPDLLSLDEYVLSTEAHPFRWRLPRDVPGNQDYEEYERGRAARVQQVRKEKGEGSEGRGEGKGKGQGAGKDGKEDEGEAVKRKDKPGWLRRLWRTLQ